MKRKPPSRRSTAAKPRAVVALTLLALLLVAPILAAPSWAATAGQVTHLSGILSVKRSDGAVKVLSIKSEVQEGDLLVTEADSFARVKFSDGAEVILRPETRLKIDNYAYNPSKPESDNVLISMLKGGFRAVTGLVGKRNREKITFQTETATIGIRGTITGMSECSQVCNQPGETDGINVDVTLGAVDVTNKLTKAKVSLGAGKFGFIPKDPNKPPVETPSGKRFDIPTNILQGKGGVKGKTADCAVPG